MDGEDEDPFASIAKFCQIPPSQQLILRNCPFARETEFFSGNTDGNGGRDESQMNYGTPVESTGIVMVSLPETPKDESTSRGDEFQTPPEELTLLVSSEEQHIAIVEHRTGGGETMAVGSGLTGGEKMVDLGKDTDLGFSEVQTLLVSSGKQRHITIVEHRSDREFGGGDETVAVAGGFMDGERMVDLGKDSDQGFWGVQNLLVGSVEHGTTVVDSSTDDRIGGGETKGVGGGCTDGEGIVELGKDSDQGFLIGKLKSSIEGDVSEQNEAFTVENPAKRLKLCEEKLGLPECSRSRANESEESEERIIRTVEDSESQEINPCELQSTKSLERNKEMWDEDFAPTEVIDSELKQNGGVLGFGEATEKGDSAIVIDECRDMELQGNLKNMEDIEKCRYVVSTGTNSRETRRQLPSSILGQVKNVAGGVSSISSPVNQSFVCLLNVLKVLAERCDPKFDDTDILEIAMRRGMTFPRPSWWPPQFRPSWWPPGYGED